VIAILVVLALAIFVVPWDDIFGGSSGGSGGSGSGSSGGGSSASIEDGIEAFFDVNYYFDLDALDRVAPDAYWDYAEEETGMSLKELKDELEDTFEDTKESAEEMLGKGYTYSFDISDEEELDDEDVEYVAQALEDTYGIDAKDVKAVVCLSIDLVIEGDEDSIDDSTSEAYMVQIGKAWYAVEVDLDDEDTDVEFAADMFLNMVY